MRQIVIGFACVLAGGYSQAEDAVKRMLRGMDDISAALESVKDPATAKAAAPKIESAVAQLQQAKYQGDLAQGTPADKEKLERAYMPKVKEAIERMLKASVSAALASGGDPAFLKAIDKMKNLK
jgi:hypothetical protein